MFSFKVVVVVVILVLFRLLIFVEGFFFGFFGVVDFWLNIVFELFFFLFVVSVRFCIFIVILIDKFGILVKGLFLFVFDGRKFDFVELVFDFFF